MPILTLLKRVKDSLNHPPHPVISGLQGLRSSYLTGLAMQAHSDGEITEEEHKHFLEMAELFSMGADEAEELFLRAGKPNEAMVNEIRRCLINSKYKYYFILDLQIMAHQDREVKVVETEVLRRFGEILEVDREDRDFLVELADAVVSNDDHAKQRWAQKFVKKPGLGDLDSPDHFEHYMA